MKLVTYRRDETISCGVVTERGVVDIPSSWPGSPAPQSLKGILERDPAGLDEVRRLSQADAEAIELESVTLLAPLPEPGKLLALAGNYAEHVKEASLQRGYELGLSDSPRQTTVPRPFLMPTSVISGPGDMVPWPTYSKEIDYELELAVVIGKRTRRVTPAEALDHVAGYTIGNDISARSVTFKEGRGARPWDEFYDWLNGKWADGFFPMGPYLVTKDEIADAQNLAMTLKVNGQVRQRANTSQMIYPVADIVSFLSHLMTLEPGDIISTGTPSGVGIATGNFLQGGDTIECAIEGLGALTNTLGERPEQFYAPLG
ncbi:MAG: fumarylacetoacetate hydrolase family protein [Planctomycetota bacterium]|jgi:2-keto-4-pentenoate hydratase/2-oxohepta-3-ene-1,7-dioic acid hydratase in catechol pathway